MQKTTAIMCTLFNWKQWWLVPFYVLFLQSAHIRKLEAENQEAANRLELVIARGKKLLLSLQVGLSQKVE